MSADDMRVPRVTDVSGPDVKFGHIGFQVDGGEYPLHAIFLDAGNGRMRYQGAVVELDRQMAERTGIALIQWARDHAWHAEPATKSPVAEQPQDVALFDVEGGAS